MNKTKLVLLFVTSGLLSMGLADCHFSASSSIYPLNHCPTSNFSWPISAKDESLQISREPQKHQEGSNTYECGDLVRYKIRKRINQQIALSKVEWATFDLYLGIVKDGECSIVASSPWVGPNLPNSQKKKGMAEWNHVTEDILRLLFKEKTASIKFPATKTFMFKGKDEYKKWCEGLHSIEIVVMERSRT